MVFLPRMKVEQFRIKDSQRGIYETIPRDITDQIVFDVMFGVEATRDVFQFSIPNIRRFEPNLAEGQAKYSRTIGHGFSKKTAVLGASANAFNPRDRIYIYAWHGDQPEDLNDALLMAGYVKSVSSDQRENGAFIKIKGANLSEFLLNGKRLAFFPKTGINNTPPLIIKKLVERLNHASGIKLDAFLDSQINPTTGSPGLIVSVNSFGSPFSPIAFNKGVRTINEHIEDLSKPEFTEDPEAGVYLFGINMTRLDDGDMINELFWKRKSGDITSTNFHGENITNMRIVKSDGKVVNAHYLSVGKDLFNNSVIEFATNTKSIAEFGLKMEYNNDIQTFDLVRTGEENAGVDAGNVYDPESHFPTTPDITTSSYFFITIPNRDADGADIGTLAVTIGKEGYNNVLRNEARIQARQRSEQILFLLGEPRIVMNADMVVGSNTLIAGDFYNTSVDAVGWIGTTAEPDAPLRLKDIKHRFSEAGWKVALKFEQDEDLLTKSFSG